MILAWQTITNLAFISQARCYSPFGDWAVVADCAEDALGTIPTIMRIDPKQSEQSQPSDINLDKLLQTGFLHNGSWRRGIIDILKLCVANK
jgi:hypothetical protein